MMSSLRRIFSTISIVFNIILAALAISNLAHNLAKGSYVDANYLLCIVSIMSVLIVGVINFLEFRHSEWMPYKLAFEICWVSMILIFQFVTSLVMSVDHTSNLCRAKTFRRLYPEHNPCPAHSAVLAFDWMAVILLLVHLATIAKQVLDLSATTGLTAFGVLRSQTKDLPASSSSSSNGDPEKNVRVNHLTLTASVSTGSFKTDSESGRQKHRPAPLDLSKVALPVYETHARAKARADAAAAQEATNHTRVQSRDINLVRQSTKPLDRHQQCTQEMLQSMRQASDAANTRRQLHPYAANRQRSASISTSSPWSPPQDWEADRTSNPGSAGHRTRSMRRQWQSVDSLPSAAAQQDKSLPSLPGQQPKVESVLNRPDPRDRRPSKPDEYQTAVGGFWHSRGERDSM